MSQLVEDLGQANVGDRVRVTTADETTFEGSVSPIKYMPEDSLRVEVRPRESTSDRYEIRADYEEEWSELTVRHVEADAEDAEWETLGTVENVEFGDEDDWDWGPSSE